MIHDDSVPRHLPHLGRPGVLSMGLQPLELRHWIEVDTSLADFHRHKLAMRKQHGDGVCDALPSSLAAQRELSALLCEHLLEHHEDAYRRDTGGMICTVGEFQFALPVDESEPLWSASLLVADDLVIMQPSASGYRLTAASLASPSHWRLQDKLGRPIGEIHDPIPGVHDQLTPSIDRFFAHITPQRPVCRFNWSLQADPGLFHPGATHTAAPRGTRLYYRVERQTLRRLPESGAIVFTIRVFLHPLALLSAVSGALDALVAAVDATPPSLSQYKGFPALRDALEQYRLESSADMTSPRRFST